jgi:hypothetical protein
MSRLLSRTSLLVLGVIALVGFSLLPAQPLTASGTVVVPTANFDIDASIVPGQGWAIPADCSVWHELYPNWCTPHHQMSYDDSDHDGLVSVCDNIIEDGGSACWHIEKVSTTYFFSPVAGGGQNAGEPSGTDPGSSPVCDQWHIVFADGPPFSYCQSVHIEGWEDNNHNGVLDVCDNIQILGGWYHIDRIGCDVTVTFNPVTGAKGGTWGWLKSLFHRK